MFVPRHQSCPESCSGLHLGSIPDAGAEACERAQLQPQRTLPCPQVGLPNSSCSHEPQPHSFCLFASGAAAHMHAALAASLWIET